MRRPTVSPLRRLRPLRSLFVCVLAALLLTGAATYSHGTRYDLPGNNFPAAAAAMASADEPDESDDPDELSGDSERRFAPRGEPAPLRTAVVDPPQVLHRLPDDAVLSAGPPAQPEFRPPTLAELSISRT